ncbi:MAG: hypothetical protein LBP65_02350 [Puniceicoccales bacterium]|nr:hypothetical protein [Puniceicoccales bacterium]
MSSVAENGSSPSFLRRHPLVAVLTFTSAVFLVAATTTKLAIICSGITIATGIVTVTIVTALNWLIPGLVVAFCIGAIWLLLLNLAEPQDQQR